MNHSLFLIAFQVQFDIADRSVMMVGKRQDALAGGEDHFCYVRGGGHADDRKMAGARDIADCPAIHGVIPFYFADVAVLAAVCHGKDEGEGIVCQQGAVLGREYFVFELVDYRKDLIRTDEIHLAVKSQQAA